MPKATMQDVAAKVGVSVATISRALRSPEMVRPQTLRKIHETIREIKYDYPLPPQAAKVPQAIGVLIPTTLTSAFADTLLGIQEAALNHSLTVTVGSTGYDATVERELLERFAGQNLAGLIMAGFSPSNEQMVHDLAGGGLPCTVMWEFKRDSSLSYIGFDNYAAFYDLTRYVVGLGHRRVGLICGPFSKSERALRRLNGFRAALEKNHLEYDPSLVFEGVPSLEAGETGFRQIMSLPEPPSAVIAGADMFALGAMAAARKMGLEIPGDVSLAGFDDIAFASYCHPTLTTVRVPAYEIGVRSVEMLMRNQGKDRELPKLCFATELIIRDSCSKPKQTT